MPTMTDQELSLLSLRDGQVEFDQVQDQALTSLGVHHATQADKQMFFHQCQRTGLDPFLKQIYMIARKTYDPATQTYPWKQTFQTGIDGFRLVVQRKAKAEGKQVKHLPVRYWDDQGTEYDAWVKATPPAMIRYTLQLGDDAPVSWDARFEEYVQLVDEYYDEDVKDHKDVVIHKKGSKTGKKVPNSMWAKRPTAQLEKCAEAGAARRAATQDLGGIYLFEEMPPDVTGRGGPIVDVDPAGVTDQPIHVSAQQEWLDKLAACTSAAEVNDTWTACRAAGMRTVAFDKAARSRAAQIKEASGDAAAPDSAENGAETPAPEAAEAPESVGSESDTPSDQASEASQNVRETPEEDDPWVEETTGQPACGAPNAGGYPTEHCRSAKGHPGDHVPGAIRKSVFDGPDE